MSSSCGIQSPSRHGSRTVAVANAAMPSPRPVNPIFSLVVALTATRVDGDAGDLGDARAHRVAVRPDARRLADDGDVEMRDASAARAHALDRECEETIGGGAAPLRIARREVHADIAVGERAEDGIDQRMQHDVGIGMPGQSARMGDAHAAERDMIARVEADARRSRSRCARRSSAASLAASARDEILRRW